MPRPAHDPIFDFLFLLFENFLKMKSLGFETGNPFGIEIFLNLTHSNHRRNIRFRFTQSYYAPSGIRTRVSAVLFLLCYFFSFCATKSLIERFFVNLPVICQQSCQMKGPHTWPLY